jgi:hypothetical protein
VSAVGDLVRGADVTWITHPPTHSPNGHELATAITDGKDKVIDVDAASNTTQQLRQELLNAGLIDWVSLSEVNSEAALLCPDLPKPQRQEIALNTMRSLVSEGLFAAGNLDTEVGRFAPFDEPLDQTMARIRDVYVDRYDETIEWAFRFWFDLTDEGTEAAMATESGREIVRKVEEDMRRRAVSN